MSDFIYSSERKKNGYLSSKLESIKKNGKDTFEYHGDWGSIALIENHYKGFEHFMNEDYICVILGSPNLKLTTSLQFTGNRVTKEIFHYIENNKDIKWDKEFSGPFCILLINKRKKTIKIITDLMGHIPIYYNNGRKNLIIGSHPDLISSISNTKNLDYISVADLFINKSITFPYTLFKEVFQLIPSSNYSISIPEKIFKIVRYWEPIEESENFSFIDYSESLKTSINSAIKSIIDRKGSIGLLMSGGEDSRMILGNLHALKVKDVNCFTFVDEENIESKIAKKVSKKYGYNHEIYYRNETYYLDNLKECTVMTGSQNNSEHVHAYGFALEHDFKQMDIVMGGLFADVYFKGNRIENKLESKIMKVKYKKSILTNICGTYKVNSSHQFLNNLVVQEVIKRRKIHLENLKKMRPKTYKEWMMIWPSSMNYNFTNYQGNRRLFASYEPLLENEIVKIMASMPQEYKLDGRLYKSAIRDALKLTKFIPHSEGHYPYFDLKINFLPTIVNKSGKKIIEKLTHKSMGSWPIWDKVISTNKMKSLIFEENEVFTDYFSRIFNGNDLYALMEKKEISPSQKMIILQVCHGISYWKS